MVFPGSSDGKEFACSAGDPGLIPDSERFPGERDGNPHQYSCLENSMPGGLQSTGLYRVGHDRASNTFTLFARHYESFGLHSVSNGNNQIARLILFLNKLIN